MFDNTESELTAGIDFKQSSFAHVAMQLNRLALLCSIFHCRLPYDGLFGGVTAFKPDHFELVNGFSNLYYGWGGEDDDMYNRSVHVYD